ncbi:MAG TPA: NAD(+) diphosphatase [Azospirillaceae bacterium]|nr:NAD(+) diphosphatase [Azospirillaceae bacterium]
MRDPNFYSSGPLDRAADHRKDESWLADRLTRVDTRVLPLWQMKNFVTGPREAPRLAFLSAVEDWWRDDRVEPRFLGLVEGIAHFAVDLSHIEEPATHPRLVDRGAFVDLRTVGPLMPASEGAMLAYARALAWWHARHRFCGVCGAPAAAGQGGHVRKCTNTDCGTQHFPRTDPAVIMLVHDGGDRCILGRQSTFPPGMHSTLAGFVEPGESLEDAVAREVFEEVGVRVTDVRYHSSQPWPFPASIMLGFHARAVDRDIRVDRNELESAAWFDRAYLRTRQSFSMTEPAPDGGLRLPRRDSIAYRLLTDWMNGGGL